MAIQVIRSFSFDDAAGYAPTLPEAIPTTDYLIVIGMGTHVTIPPGIQQVTAYHSALGILSPVSTNGYGHSLQFDPGPPPPFPFPYNLYLGCGGRPAVVALPAGSAWGPFEGMAGVVLQVRGMIRSEYARPHGAGYVANGRDGSSSGAHDVARNPGLVVGIVGAVKLSGASPGVTITSPGYSAVNGLTGRASLGVTGYGCAVGWKVVSALPSAESISASLTGSPDHSAAALFEFWGVDGGGVHNYSSRRGYYYNAHNVDGAITLRRSPVSAPPFEATFAVSSGQGDSRPMLAEDARGRLVMALERAGDTMDAHRMLSDDDGATWSTPTVIIASGRFPVVLHDARSGATAYLARVGSNIHRRIQYPGDAAPAAAVTATDPAGAALVVDEDAFSVTPSSDASGRWLLAARQAGVIRNYQSWDDGQTWTEIA